LNFRGRKGIAQIVIVGVIVIVIVVAAAGAYFAFSSGGSSTGTTSTTKSSSSLTTSTPSTGTTTSSVGTSSTTTATSSSASSTSSVVSSSTTYSTFSCASTYTTTSGTPTDYTPQFISLIQQFSSMNFSISGTESGKQESVSFAYTSTSPSSGIYNVTIASVTNSTATPAGSFLVDANNATILKASYSGFVVSGTEAKSLFDASMGIFGLNEYFSSELGVYTDPTYFTNQGTSTQMFGTVSFPVTTYAANSTPESITYCGVSATLTAFQLEIGTPPGTNLQFIVLLHFAGTSQGQSVDITFQLVSIVVRS